MQKPEHIAVDNGTSLYLFNDSSLDIIYLCISVKAGKLFETKPYLAKSLYTLLTISSTEYPDEHLDQFLSFYGSDFSVNINLQNVEIKIVVPKNNCQIVLPVIFNTLQNPTFQEEKIDIFKTKSIKNLEYNNLKNNFRASQLLFSTLFEENTPLGTIIQNEHIQDITIQDLMDYHKKTYTAQNITIFACGNLDKELQNIIQNLANQLPSSYTTTIASSKPQTKPSPLIIETRPNSLQSSFYLCKNLFGYNNPDRKEFSFVTKVLGGYFGSRLMQNLREKNGFTYGVNCHSLYYADQSIFYIESDVMVNKTKAAIEECKHEIMKLQTEYISDTELNIVKTYIKGILMRNLDGVLSYMKQYIFWNEFNCDESQINLILEKTQQIDKERIRELTEQYISVDSLSLIVVGNYE